MTALPLQMKMASCLNVRPPMNFPADCAFPWVTVEILLHSTKDELRTKIHGIFYEIQGK